MVLLTYSDTLAYVTFLTTLPHINPNAQSMDRSR